MRDIGVFIIVLTVCAMLLYVEISIIDRANAGSPPDASTVEYLKTTVSLLIGLVSGAYSQKKD